MNKYHHRRRFISAFLVSTTFAVLDQIASSGTELGFVSTWCLFTSLSFLPLVIGYILDELGDLKNENHR